MMKMPRRLSFLSLLSHVATTAAASSSLVIGIVFGSSLAPHSLLIWFCRPRLFVFLDFFGVLSTSKTTSRSPIRRISSAVRMNHHHFGFLMAVFCRFLSTVVVRPLQTYAFSGLCDIRPATTTSTTSSREFSHYLNIISAFLYQHFYISIFLYQHFYISIFLYQHFYISIFLYQHFYISIFLYQHFSSKRNPIK
jgi:hypothetical protein